MEPAAMAACEGDMAASTALLVSEQPNVVEQVRQACADTGAWSLVVSETPADALQRLARSRFDLFLFHLPNSYGAADISRLRRHAPTVPLVILWDHSLKNMPVRVLDANVSAFICWPDQAGLLAAKMAEICETRKVLDRACDVEMRLANLQADLDRYSLVIATLYGVGRALAHVVDEFALFESVADAAQHLVMADEGSVLLCQKGESGLVLQSKRMSRPIDSSDGHLRVEASLAEMVVQTGQTLLIADMAARSERSARYVRSLLDVPLKLGEQVVGVVSVTNKVTNRSFSEDDSLVLSILADYASVALENARLYKQSQQGTAVDIFRQTVATLSHHVNNPLAAMLAALHMLRTDLQQRNHSAPPNGRTLRTLEAMEAKADEIASVIAVMQDVMVPTSTAYWKGERMIDIEKELRRRLSALSESP